MKRIYLTLIMICIIAVAFATSITLIDQTTLEGEIIGKQADSLFMQINDKAYCFQKDDIEKITNGGSTIKNIIFNKKDWGINSGTKYRLKTMTQDTNEPVIRSSETGPSIATMKLDSYKAIGKIPLDQMTEREYQLYLAQIQAKAINDNASKISGTMWGIFGAGVALSVIVSLIVSGSAK